MKLMTKFSGVALGMALSGMAMATGPVEMSTISLGVGPLPASFSTSKNFMSGTTFEHTWNFDFSSAAQVVAFITDMQIGSFFNISNFQINVDHGGWTSLPGDTLSGMGTVSAGTHTLQISGVADGSFGGAYAFSFSAVPVPEAETWAMMLAGLGLVGLRLRKQYKQESRLSA